MKASIFEKLIRRVIREEIDYSLRREIKSLKEDLRDELKPTIVEHTERLIKTPTTPKPQISEKAKNSLKEKMIKPQSFVQDTTLNDLLHETAMGNTNTAQSAMPDKPFSSPDPLETSSMPKEVADAVTRDYSGLMKAITDKKGR